MPDAGDFERTPAQAPAGWAEAFNALPLEAADAGRWQRLQARLAPQPPARVRRRSLWLATAASLAAAMAVAIPLLLRPDAPLPGSDTGVVGTIAAAPAAATPIATEAAPATAPPATPATGDAAATPLAGKGEARSNRVAPAQRPIRTAAPPRDTTLVAAHDATPATPDLEPLYARSAQLEQLLAMARDERVASGTGAAITDQLDARIAGIDAALIQPGLDARQRADLWDRRVDALQQLVGIETTNRLYAARGQRYDAALVAID